MNRRAFIKIGTLFFAVGMGCNTKKYEGGKLTNYPITIDSNRSIGHLARKSLLHGISQEIKTDVLIVGAGIAGMAAACSLKGRDNILCDLNPHLGGTSGAITIDNQQFSQGAHYDMSYPGYYGEDGLELLESLNIIVYNNTLDRWDFKDKQHVIKTELEERCYRNGQLYPSVLVDSELKQNFLDLMHPYNGKMVLPTTQINANIKNLDHLTFSVYLNKYLPVTSDFMEAIDYQMMDDYGGKSDQVSALAGIHYYRCRPYYSKLEPEIFSPTEGNYYFIQKMMNHLNSEQVKPNSLVVGLEKLQKGWDVDIWEVTNERKVRYTCKNVIYAGQKHLLKYIHPESYKIFNDVKYAPWIVINIELQGESIDEDFWQNDFLSTNGQFLGFINSRAQTKKGNRVLTAYYCYPDIYHHMVQDLENGANEIVDQTITFINTYFKKDLDPFIKHVYVKLLGHAMPIPVPGYLSKNREVEKDGLSFAGVDTGRLPLMFDALDSGIQAAKRI
ncbi:MAG: hypothetical protein COC01_00985 [Bacteroidetes bacterium]|nr:NAD(P)-binding protein [Bacteroidia bacterium]PCH69694.1 MAG: hypothetical protein COC01_00985 [Bacteroidota bacterium]